MLHSLLSVTCLDRHVNLDSYEILDDHVILDDYEILDGSSLPQTH